MAKITTFTEEERNQLDQMRKDEAERKAKMKFMKTEIEDLELKSRYWKANWEIKHYSMLDNEITPKYQEMLMDQQGMLAQALEEEAANKESELEIKSSLILPANDIITVKPNL